MEDQHFLDTDNLKVENERPSFLTVLCIITFVVSGFMLIYSMSTALTYDELAVKEAIELQIAEMEENPEISENPAVGRIMEGFVITAQETIEHNSTLTIIGFVGILLSLGGAIMMFFMRKIGFHLYTISKIVGLSPMLILTNTLVVNVIYIFMAVISLVFIIMYSRNLKYLS